MSYTFRMYQETELERRQREFCFHHRLVMNWLTEKVYNGEEHLYRVNRYDPPIACLNGKFDDHYW